MKRVYKKGLEIRNPTKFSFISNVTGEEIFDPPTERYFNWIIILVVLARIACGIIFTGISLIIAFGIPGLYVYLTGVQPQFLIALSSGILGAGFIIVSWVASWMLWYNTPIFKWRELTPKFARTFDLLGYRFFWYQPGAWIPFSVRNRLGKGATRLFRFGEHRFRVLKLKLLTCLSNQIIYHGTSNNHF